MFRTAMCPSSGELIVSMRHLVYVILCRWQSGLQVWVKPKPANLIIEVSLLHSDTPYLVRLLWTSEQPDAETSTRLHTTLTREKTSCTPRRDSIPQSQQANGRRPLPYSTVYYTNITADLFLPCPQRRIKNGILKRWDLKNFEQWNVVEKDVRSVWFAGLGFTQTCNPDRHLHRVTYTRCRIDTINSPDDGHIAVRNM